MSDVFFAAPVWLLGLPLGLALAVLASLRRWPAAGTGRRIAGAIVRGAGFAAVLLALADPRWHEHDDVAHVVFVVDRSASIPDDALRGAFDRVESLRSGLDADVRVGLVVFDRAAEVAVVPGQPWTVPSPLRETPVEATDIDAAVGLALGLVPADDGGEIVLLSDGRRTTLAADTPSLHEAERRGIAVHTVAIEPRHDDPAVAGVLLTQTTVRPGARVDGRVVLEGGRSATPGRLVVRLGDETVFDARVDAPAGEAVEIPFAHDLDAKAESGTATVSARFEPDSPDTVPANNEASSTLVVSTPPAVRIVAGERHDAETLARALRAERMSVQVVQATELTREHEDLSDVDLVVLANAPASTRGSKAMEPSFIEAVTRFVDRGGGLLVLGGPQAFDMGSYGNTKLAHVLPVKLDAVDPEVESAATIIIILDRSGSMSAMVSSSKTKMELADEGAAASIRLLRPFDLVGVMSVTETVRWEVPTQPVVDPEALERKVLRVRADGGGIFVYTSLVAAEAALEHVDTPLRHVILFSDAADSEEKVKGIPFGTGPGPTAEEVARRMHSRGITTSVIGIGAEEDIDTQFLKDLARAGGGRFYLTDDATKLRSLFVAETERLVDSSMVEAEFRPTVAKAHPIINGIDYPSGPTLAGYQELQARPTAEVVLEGPEQHPLLTTWRYGLGQVVAWSSDAGPRWSERWLGWDGYAKQWTQAARFALRQRSGDDTAIEVDFAADRARVRIARRDPTGLTLDETGLSARVRRGDEVRELALGAAEPGLWEAELAVEHGSAYVVEVVDADGKVLAEQPFAPPPSSERRHRSADRPWLDEIARRTQGTVDPQRLEPATAAAVTTDVHRLWPYLLLLALALLPVDAFLRRPARVL